MALVIIFVSLIVAVHSQRFCVSTSLGTGVFSELNGQYVYKGGQNHGKNYYELDNTGQTDCANPAYLYYNFNPGDGWYVGESFAIYTFECASITDPQDPSTCTNWVDGGGTTVGPVVTAGDCPYDAMCDTITLSQPAGNCSGVFNYIKPNQFTNGNGEYLIYQEKAEKWICWKNIGNVWGCPFALLGIPNSWKQIDPSGMKRPFQNGDTQAYDGIAFGTQSINIELTCSGHNTHNPSPDPTYAPTYPTITPTKTPSNNPTITPTKYPSKTPTFNPSKTPSNSPTTPIPTQSPTTSNPTITPTFYPSNSPSIPTMIPTYYPTMIPTLIPTEHPSPDPTILTLWPSDDPTMRPTVEDFTTKAPTNPSISPTRNPTKRFTTFDNEIDLDDVKEDGINTFNYYWSNYNLYMIIGGVVLVLLIAIMCWCCCCRDPKNESSYKNLRKRRERIREMRRQQARQHALNNQNQIPMERVTSTTEML